MIIALVLINESDAARYFETEDGETTIERVTGTVLRGPFGGTLVAAIPALSAKVKNALQGFAVKHVELPAGFTAHAGPHLLLMEALKAAEAFRARWEKAMAAAAGRFEKTRGTEAPTKGAGGEWSKHKQSADVKIRGLARSFERDGVLVLPGDCIEIKKEHLAHMVEAFAREGQTAAAKPFAQALVAGVRGWPVMLSLEGAREVAALPAGTIFSEWLLKNVERVCDIKVSG